MAVSPASNALITFAEMQAYFGSDVIRDADQDDVQTIINGVSNRIEQLIGRSLKAADYTEYRDFHPQTYKVLPYNTPVNSVASIYIDGDRAYGTATLIDSDYYRVRNNAVRFYSDKVDHPSCYEGSVKITYNGGYTTIPDDIKQACAEMCLEAFQRIRNTRTGQERFNTPDGLSVEYFPETANIRSYQAIMRYKRTDFDNEW